MEDRQKGATGPPAVGRKPEKADTKARVSREMDGHQNRCLIEARVRWNPGWKASLQACSHCKTCDLPV